MTPVHAPERLRIATRESPLAWYQAELVGARLQAAHPGLEIELVGIKTEGDRLHDRSLAEAGGKGLFVKALEQGLFDGRADIAVHSIKDVPGAFPEGLHMPVILARESPFDAFLAPSVRDPRALPAGAVIGTSSPRRASQLLYALPHCRIEALRGNVHTRLAKLDRGDFDAIVLAVAGLQRLGLGARAQVRLDTDLCLPAIGQGALGIECRADDPAINACIAPLNDAATAACVHAERAVSRGLEGNCLSPIAGHGVLAGARLQLQARVAAPDGSRLIADARAGHPASAEALGGELAQALLAAGADEVLAAAGAH